MHGEPYLNDLTRRVAVAIASGDSCRAIAEQYEIAPSTVVKW
jgi:transposase